MSAPTAPVRSIVPSMTDASSSTSPKRFGQPPRPTVRTFSSSSTSRIPASTASRAAAPSAKRRVVTGMPEVPSLLVTTIIAAVLVLQVASDLSTYYCNVRFRKAEMPAFATGMGAKTAIEERGRNFRSRKRDLGHFHCTVMNSWSAPLFVMDPVAKWSQSG